MSPAQEAEARAMIARLDAQSPEWRTFGVLRTAVYLDLALAEVDRVRKLHDEAVEDYERLDRELELIRSRS